MPDASPLATLAGFALGAIRYGPIFGRARLAETGFTGKRLRRDIDPALSYGVTFVLGLVAAYAFGAVLGPAPGFGRAIALG